MIQYDNFKAQTPYTGSSYLLPGEWPDGVSIKDMGNFLEIVANVDGETTNHSERTRTEFRECAPDGTEVNFLVTDAHIHRMTIALDEVCSNGRVVLGQIHVKDNDRPPLKLYYDNGALKIGFRATYNQETDVKSTIAQGISLGSVINYSIINVGNNQVKVYTNVNGVAMPTWVDSFNSTWAGKWLYSKGGIYNQLDASLSTGPNDRSLARVYKLEVE